MVAPNIIAINVIGIDINGLIAQPLACARPKDDPTIRPRQLPVKYYAWYDDSFGRWWNWCSNNGTGWQNMERQTEVRGCNVNRNAFKKKIFYRKFDYCFTCINLFFETA